MAFTQVLEHELEKFPFLYVPKEGEKLTELEGVQRLVMLDRYAQKDALLETLKEGDVVLTTVKYDPKFPTQGYGKVKKINNDGTVTVDIEYPEHVDTDEDLHNLVRPREDIVKPVEIYWEQIAYRVARGAAQAEEESKREYWFRKFYHMLKNMYYIPGGRVLYGAGSGVEVTLFNCFVLPRIPDSRGGIIDHIRLAAEIMSRGGGVGSNISTLRPKGAPVFGVNGYSSGPVSWANYLAQLTHLIEQAGTRRGAQMIGLADWHPDIIEFAVCKIQNPHVLDKIIKETNDKKIKETAEMYLVRDANGKPVSVRDLNFMTGANISVLISDDFMEAVKNDEIWELRYPDLAKLTPEQKKIYDEQWHTTIGDVRIWEKMGLPVKVYHRIRARDLWHLFMVCARYSAEPGVIFIDRYNKEANSYYYAPILVTNPCGEQGLPAFGVCNLGAINLEKMYDPEKNDVNWELLREVVHVSQRFSDNITDISYYFLPENEKMAKMERRIGKGVMGLADLMIYLKLPYGSEEMLKKTDEIFKFIAVESYLASADLAEEKGSFPAFDAEKILNSGYMKRMPEHVREAVRKKGLRNVCSLTVAPTGSTGTMVGVSTGLEPYYAFKFYRTGRLGKFVEINVPIAQKYFDEHPDAKELPDYFVSAMDLSAEDHIRVQATIQKWVDSSLSKTANAPSTFTVEDTKKLYEMAYDLGCKGVTIYVDGSRDTQVLSLEAKDNKFEEVEEEKLLQDETEQEEPTDIDLTSDTRACVIRFDENGNMIRECGTE